MRKKIDNFLLYIVYRGGCTQQRFQVFVEVQKDAALHKKVHLHLIAFLQKRAKLIISETWIDNYSKTVNFYKNKIFELC